MRAKVCHQGNDIGLDEVPAPIAGPNQAVVTVSLTTSCGSDFHIAQEEWPVAAGRILGHEAVGTISEIRPGVQGFQLGRRMLALAITSSGGGFYYLNGQWSQCAGPEEHWVPRGGWRLGSSIDGCQAEYFRVPYGQANMALIPD